MTLTQGPPPPVVPGGPSVGAGAAAPLVGVEPFRSVEESALGLLEVLWSLCGLEVLLVTRVDEAEDALHVVAALVDGSQAPAPTQSWSGSLCVHMVSGRGPAAAEIADVPVFRDAPNIAGQGFTRYVGVPVLRGDGELHGTLCGFGRAPWDEGVREWVPLFRTVARLLGGLLRLADVGADQLNDALAEHASELAAALTDPVTGVANRTGLEQAVARVQRTAASLPVAVVVVDVDGLKAVNDQHGHDAGDALLRRVAEVVRPSLRSTDVLGRLGGDEFLVLVPGERSDGAGVARVRAALDDLPVSYGVADTSSDDDLTAARTRADARMYEQKLVRAAARRPTGS